SGWRRGVSINGRTADGEARRRVGEVARKDAAVTRCPLISHGLPSARDVPLDPALQPALPPARKLQPLSEMAARGGVGAEIRAPAGMRPTYAASPRRFSPRASTSARKAS